MVSGWFEVWLRGQDLNLRPLGYERPGARVNSRLYGTYGYPGVRKGTLWTPFWEPVGSEFGRLEKSTQGLREFANYVAGAEELDARWGSNQPTTAGNNSGRRPLPCHAVTKTLVADDTVVKNRHNRQKRPSGRYLRQKCDKLFQRAAGWLCGTSPNPLDTFPSITKKSTLTCLGGLDCHPSSRHQSQPVSSSSGNTSHRRIWVQLVGAP